MNAIIALLLLACVLTPACYVTAALPALWLLQISLLGNPSILISAGSVDFTLVDVVLLMLYAKVAVSVILRRELTADRPLYLAIAFYLAVEILATFASATRFDNAHMMRGLTAMARFMTEIAIVPVLAQTITSMPQARRCAHIFFATLLVLGLIQFVNFLGASHGIVIGEVQGIERGEARYFGPIGDSVGFVLLLGYLISLCFWKPAGVFLFGGGIVLTAGIGAMFATGVATLLFVIFGIQAEAVRVFARKYLWIVPALVFSCALAAATFGQSMAKTFIDRFTNGKVSESAGQRMISTTLAMRIIKDNPLFGVGYMGYSTALPHYGGRQYFDFSKPDGGRANANNQLLQSLTDAGIVGLLATAALIAAGASLFRRASAQTDDPMLGTLFRAAFIWLLALVFGNHAAVWIIPSSHIARFLWVLLGIAVAVLRLSPTANATELIPEDRRELAAV